MGKLQSEMSGAKQVQAHRDNEKRPLDTRLVWVV